MHCMKRLKLKTWSVHVMFTGTPIPSYSETCEVTFIYFSLRQFWLTVCIHLYHRECLKLIPHSKFSFAKIWLLVAQFEIRQLNLAGARQILGNAIGKAPKDKVILRFVWTLHVFHFNHIHGLLTFDDFFSSSTNRYSRSTSRLNSSWET